MRGSTIRIGTILPLSGPPNLRSHVKSMLGGTQALIGAVNANGGVNGHEVELHVEDSAYDIGRTISSARKLIEEKQVIAIVNSNGTPQMEATFSFVLDERQIPIINTWGGRPQWFTPARPRLFGLQILYDDVARILGGWAVKDGHRNVLVVHPDFPAISPIMATRTKIGAAAFAADARLSLLTVRFGEIDPTPIIERVRELRPDAIIVFINQPETVALLRALYESKLVIPVYTWASNVSRDIIELGGEAAEGFRGLSLTIATPFDSSESVVRYRNVLQRYAPDLTPDFMSLFTYAETQVFIEALSKIGGAITSAAICESLECLSGVDTEILPPVGYSATCHLGSHLIQPMMIKESVWVAMGAPINVRNEVW